MEDKYNIKASDWIHMVHINLAKLRKIDYNSIISGQDNLKKDLYFLICSDNEKLDLVYEGDKLMKDVVKNAKQIAGVEAMDLYLTDEEMLKLDQEYAMQKGIEQNQKKVIMNMVNENLTLDTISKYVGLPLEQVKKIVKEQKDI